MTTCQTASKWSLLPMPADRRIADDRRDLSTDRSEDMYALLGHVDIDPNRVDEAEALLRERLLPRVKEMEGFVSGTFTRDRAGRWGRSVVIFENEAAAEKAAEAAAAMAPPEGAPLQFRTFDIAEVIVQA